ncbi:MAG: hypothetical protein ACR2QL_13485 [Woeseiaceae bacterium]
MRLPKILLLLLAAGTALADDRAYLLGAGLETDSDDGLRGSLLAGVEVGDSTWLSGGFAAASVELASGRTSHTRYVDVEFDHHFDPIGIALGVAYWGDPDLLDSVDQRFSLYFRNERFSIAGEYEYRDFDFIIPPTNFFPGREFAFDADGFGARIRYEFTKTFRMSASAMKYDYSVDFRPDENRDAVSLLTISRFSLINSLVDSRASMSFGVDVGSGQWGFDYATWKGALDQSRTKSYTVRFLHPMSTRTDLELALGYDDSDLYGNITFLSLYLFFYGS